MTSTQDRQETGTIGVQVMRYRPDRSTPPILQEYDVPLRKEWTVLDALNYVKNEVDPTLSSPPGPSRGCADWPPWRTSRESTGCCSRGPVRCTPSACGSRSTWSG